MELNQIPQNPNNWGNVADLLNENSGKIEAETAKLNNVTTKFKGYFSTSTALSAKWPSPLVGDTAWVGATYPGVVYRCNVAGTWLATTDVPSSNTVNLSEYSKLSGNEEFTGIKKMARGLELKKGFVAYGQDTLLTGVGRYVAAYVSPTFGSRILSYDGVNYYDLVLGAYVNGKFGMTLKANGEVAFGHLKQTIGNDPEQVMSQDAVSKEFASVRSDLNELDADYSNTFGDGSNDSDLSVEDPQGNIIMMIKKGRIQTKDSPLYPLDSDSDSDFDIQDEDENSILRIKNGIIESGKPPITPINNDSNADLDFKDKNDNSIFKILNGYPYSGRFDGHKIKYLSDDYDRKYRTFESFILDPVPSQNIGNATRDFDLNNITVAEFYTKWDELIVASNGYISKTVLGLDASNTYEIWRLDLSSQNYNGKLTNDKAIDIKAKKKVYIHAGLHGDTYDPNNHIFMLYYIAKCLVYNYRTNSLWAKIRKEYDFVFIPIANPWGIENPTYAYGQSQNINIDRNWDWRFKPNDSASWAPYATSGTEPFSCVESQYLRDVLLSIKDELTFAIDLHSHSRYYNMGRIILLDRHTLFSDILYENAKRVMQYTGDMVDNQLCQVGYQDCYGNSGGYIPNVLGVPSYIVECQCAEYNVTDYSQMYSSNALTADLYVILASILNF